MASNISRTKCPKCLAVFSAVHDEILRHNYHCPTCEPRIPQPHPDTALLNYIESRPNPALLRVVRAYYGMKAMGVRGAIKWVMKNQPSL